MRRALSNTGIGAAVAAVAVVLWLALSGSSGRDSSSEGESAASTPEALEAVRLHGSSKRSRAPAEAVLSLHVRGRVVDRSAAPLVGVPVAARRVRPLRSSPQAESAPRETDEARFRKTLAEYDAPTSGPHTYESNGVTAADGAFDLVVKETGAYDLEAIPAAPSIGTGRWITVSEEETSERTTLFVIDGSRLEGRFVDGAGRGVVAVLGGDWDIEGLAEGWAMDPVKSAADGRFVVDAVPNGRASLDVTVPGRGTLDGIVATTPHDGPLTIRIGGFGGVVHGQVKDSSGRPIANADVSMEVTGTAAASGPAGGAPAAATHATLRSRTGVDGAYRIEDAFTGRVTELQALAEGYVLHASRVPLAPWSGAAVAAGTETKIDVVLSHGATASGHVVREGSRERVAKARILLQRLTPGAWPRPKPFEVVAGDDGAFRTDGLALGKWVAVASAPGLYDIGIESWRGTSDESGERRGPPPENTFILMREGETVDRTLVVASGTAVKGRVLSPDGKGVEGASIRASDADVARSFYEWGGQWSSDESPEVARSEADGAFVVPGLAPRSDWHLVAFKAPFVGKRSEPFAVVAGETTPDVVLRLETGASIAGRVLSDDGKPIFGAHVYWNGREEWGSGRNDSVSSGPDGTFLLEGLPAASVEVQAWANEFSWKSKKVEPPLAPGEARAGFELRLAREARIRGVIVDEKGEAVPDHDIQVELSGSGNSWSTSSDADGSFSLDVPAGEHVVVKVEVEAGRTEERAAEPPADGLRFVVKATPATVLEGRVVDPAGSPVPLCHVRWETDGQDSEGIEAVGGAFRVQAKGSPPYVLRASGAKDASGMALNLMPGEATVADPTAGPVTIVLAKGLEIRGRVVGDDGKAVARAVVRMREDARGNEDRSPSFAARTADDGSFAILALAAGAYVLFADPPAPYVAPADVHVAAGATDLTILVQKGAAITGRVVGADGRPRGQVNVRAEWKSGSPSGSVQDASREDGTFHLDAVPPQVLAVVTAWRNRNAQDADDVLLNATVTDVRAGSSDVVVRMGAGAAIRGVVTAPGGALPPGLVVHCRRASDPVDEYADQMEVEDGANGVFRLLPLEPGEWMVSVRSPSAGEVAKAASVRAPSSGVRLVVPDPLEVTGRLIGDGDLKGFTITVWVDGRPPDETATFETAADGTFTMRLPRGPTYRFIASRSDDDRYGASGPIRPGTAAVAMNLAVGAAISGTLERAPGSTPRQGSFGWVTAQSADWVSDGNNAQEDGHFLVRGLPPGTYTLVGHAPDGETQVKVEGVTTGSSAVRLHLP